MLRNLMFFITFTAFFACKNDKNAANTGGGVGVGKVTALTERKIENRTLVPNVQFGNAPANVDEYLLKKIFGDSNVTRKKSETVVFENSPQEITVIWQKNKTFRRVEKVCITQQNSIWKLRNGSCVGDDVEHFLPEDGVSIDTSQQKIVKISVQMNN
jgi:hypothetical protein